MGAQDANIPGVTDDPVLRLILTGKAKSLDEAEEMYLDESLPEILELSRGTLREIGTTNKTRLGDYLSVDTAVFDGAFNHLITMDKLPLAERFRETGCLGPSTLRPDRLASERSTP